MIDFDKAVDRSSTYSFKWERYKDKDILPAWVADTEFESPESVKQALIERAEHGLYGYTLPEEYAPANDAVVDWCKKRYDWKIDKSWIVWTPGVVPAFNMAINAFTEEGDGVIVQTPNYPPLLAAPRIQKRRRYEVKCVEQDGRWTLDFDALETLASQSDTKLFILCNPMNPVGSVLTQAEIDRVTAICAKHNVTVCSDEIHCDLVLNGQTHLPISKQSAIANNSVTLMAASKTFNVAGLGTSFAIIPDASVRQKFKRGGAGIVPWANIMGLVATEEAFNSGEAYRQELLSYLADNRDFLVEEINKIPGLKALSPDATFLLWVDASGLGVTDTQKWCEERGVGPSPGRDFGQPNCFRINFGCSRAYLEKIVARLSASAAVKIAGRFNR